LQKENNLQAVSKKVEGSLIPSMDAETKPKKEKYDYVMPRVYDEPDHYKLERELAQSKLKKMRTSIDDKLEVVSRKNISDDKS